MRALILAAGATLALAACGDGETRQAAVNEAEAEAGVSIATNDTTAIDAATGDAANMAEDVEFDDVNAAGNASDNEVANAVDEL